MGVDLNKKGSVKIEAVKIEADTVRVKKSLSKFNRSGRVRVLGLKYVCAVIECYRLSH